MRGDTVGTLIAFAVGFFVAGVIFSRGCSPPNITESTTSDTIVIRDTVVVRDTLVIKVPAPSQVDTVKYDTLRNIQKSDTTKIREYANTDETVIPIVRKTYQNEEFKAVIEGYKPELISMEVYPKTTTIRDTVIINNTTVKIKQPRWVMSVGPGVGYGPKGLEPYIGVHVGFRLWSK